MVKSELTHDIYFEGEADPYISASDVLNDKLAPFSLTNLGTPYLFP